MNAAQMSRIPPHVPPALTVDFNYYDQPGGRENPHDAWSRLHSGPDIFFTPQYGGHWVITRFKDLKAIFDDHATFSSWRNAIPDYPRSFRLAPIETDPPLHERYKQLLVPTFAPSTIKDFETRARALTASLIERFLKRGRCEFVSEFSLAMPIGIFMQIAGLPEEDRPQLLQWVEDKVHNPDENVQLAASNAMIDYARQLVRERRRRPSDDLFSKIANVEYDGEKLSQDDVVGFFTLLLFAGLDTVSSSLGFIARFLAEHPEHRRQLQTGQFPACKCGETSSLWHRHPSLLGIIPCAHRAQGVHRGMADMHSGFSSGTWGARGHECRCGERHDSFAVDMEDVNTWA